MVLEDEKKKIILKRLKKMANKKFLAILVTSVFWGFVVMILLSFLGDSDTNTIMMAFGMFTLLMFLFQLDDFLIAICTLVECLALKKAETKYYIAKASQINPSPWLFHLGSRLLNHKKAVYEYEGKRRTRMLWGNVMVKSKDFRLLLLVPENKHKNIYAFPLVNFLDVVEPFEESRFIKMKNGHFAIYRGKEFIAGRSQNGKFLLQSTDIEDIVNYGFEKCEPIKLAKVEKPIVCFKRVDPQEIEKYYRAFAIAYYCGFDFEVIDENEQEVLILAAGGDIHNWETLGMKRKEQFLYYKWVKRSEVKMEPIEDSLNI